MPNGDNFIKSYGTLIFKVLAIIVAAVVTWFALVSQVKNNTHDIGEVRTDFDEHLEKVEAEPLTPHEISVQVQEHEEEIDCLEAEDRRQSNLQIQLMTNQAILVQNNKDVTEAVVSIKEDIALIKGKMDIE